MSASSAGSTIWTTSAGSRLASTDHGHILQPYFNNLVETPVLGQALMHHRVFMGWLLADN